MAASGSTLLSLFDACLAHHADRTIITFLDDEGRDADALTPASLDRAARRAMAQLRAVGVRPGDRVILCFPPSLDFVRAFFGCLYAGAIAVPAFPPDLRSVTREMSRLDALAADCGARLVLCSRALGLTRRCNDWVQLAMGRPSRVDWRVLEGGDGAEVGALSRSNPGPDDLAFLQYTSGSTGHPKGVMVSHGNVHDDLEANSRVSGMTPGCRAVSWLPQYHDMGLQFLLLACTGRLTLHVMSPLTFLKRPGLWFQAMSRIRATHTAAPNFAFEHALRRTLPESRTEWNLASLTHVLCAAEPIRADTLRRFAQGFAVTGFRPDAFCTGYGLAECTLGVAFRRGLKTLRVSADSLARGRAVLLETGATPPTATVELVSCGPVVAKRDASLLIVDSSTCEALEPLRIGEVWVDGSSKGQGYFGKPELSEDAFRAAPSGPSDPQASHAYLRTGDLGFIHEDELYIIGRIKDTIIIRGRNFHPQDIEEAVRGCHPGIRAGGVVAFPVERGDGEGLALMVEMREAPSGAEQRGTVVRAIRGAVTGSQGVHCDVVVAVKVGAVTKTSSGKVRRRACRERWQSGSLRRDGVLLFEDRVSAGRDA